MIPSPDSSQSVAVGAVGHCRLHSSLLLQLPWWVQSDVGCKLSARSTSCHAGNRVKSNVEKDGRCRLTVLIDDTVIPTAGSASAADTAAMFVSGTMPSFGGTHNRRIALNCDVVFPLVCCRLLRAGPVPGS